MDFPSLATYIGKSDRQCYLGRSSPGPSDTQQLLWENGDSYLVTSEVFQSVYVIIFLLPNS